MERHKEGDLVVGGATASPVSVLGGLGRNKKKLEREEEKLKMQNRELSSVKMKSMFAIGFTFTALMGKKTHLVSLGNKYTQFIELRTHVPIDNDTSKKTLFDNNVKSFSVFPKMAMTRLPNTGRNQVNGLLREIV